MLTFQVCTFGEMKTGIFMQIEMAKHSLSKDLHWKNGHRGPLYSLTAKNSQEKKKWGGGGEE